MRHFAICSNSSCKYATPFDASWFWPSGEEETYREEDTEKFPPFCELCGSRLLYFCPHCKKGLFTIPNVLHCRQCGKELKTRD